MSEYEIAPPDASASDIARSEPRVLWVEVRDGVTWSCELRDNGPHGIDARLLQDGRECVARCFPLCELAVMWAQLEREEL